MKWNGTAWAAQSSGTTQRLSGVWGTSATNLWAVGDGGTILKGNYDLPSYTDTNPRRPGS